MNDSWIFYLMCLCGVFALAIKYLFYMSKRHVVSLTILTAYQAVIVVWVTLTCANTDFVVCAGLIPWLSILEMDISAVPLIVYGYRCCWPYAIAFTVWIICCQLLYSFDFFFSPNTN